MRRQWFVARDEPNAPNRMRGLTVRRRVERERRPQAHPEIKSESSRPVLLFLARFGRRHRGKAQNRPMQAAQVEKIRRRNCFQDCATFVVHQLRDPQSSVSVASPRNTQVSMNPEARCARLKNVKCLVSATAQRSAFQFEGCHAAHATALSVSLQKLDCACAAWPNYLFGPF